MVKKTGPHLKKGRPFACLGPTNNFFTKTEGTAPSARALVLKSVRFIKMVLEIYVDLVVDEMEGEIVFAGNRKKFRPLAKAPSMPHPIGSKPVINSHPEMSMPGPLQSSSADSLDSLQNFSDRVKSRQPTIEIIHDSNTGYILRDPDAELASQRLMTPNSNRAIKQQIFDIFDVNKGHAF